MRRNRSVGLELCPAPQSCGFGTTSGDGPEGAPGCEGRMSARQYRRRPFWREPGLNWRFSAWRCPRVAGFGLWPASYGRVWPGPGGNRRFWPGPAANRRFWPEPDRKSLVLA